MSEKKRKKPSVIRQKFPKRMQKKLVVLFVTILLAFVGLVGKATYINASSRGHNPQIETFTKAQKVHDLIVKSKNKLSIRSAHNHDANINTSETINSQKTSHNFESLYPNKAYIR